MINWKSTHKSIMAADNILLTTHENPDGDGLGSAAAMWHHLRFINKNCRIINISKLPAEFGFLNKNIIFETYNPDLHNNWISKVNLALVFDVGDFERLRGIGEYLLEKNIYTVNIDHHPDTGKGKFSQDLIDTSAAAVGEMIYNYLKFAEAEFTIDLCEGLYTAILTDTGSFRHNNTNEKCHEIAILCIRQGVDTAKIYQHIYESSSRSKVLLLGKIINSLKFSKNGELAWFTLNMEVLDGVGADPKDVDGITDYVRSIRGVEVALMVFQNGIGSCRLNLRSRGKYVINDIAISLGGGGHKFAAGAVVPGNSKEVIEIVLKAAYKSLREQSA